MIEAVLFDLDDTVCEYRRSGEELLSVAFERAGVEPFFEVGDYYAVYDEYAAEADGVADNRERCFEAIATGAGRDPEVGRAVAREYADERDHRNVRFRPGARGAIERLGDGHRLGMVTNGAPGMQSRKLDSLGIGDAFEVIVHGGHDAPLKPSPEPFRRALDALSARADRAVHVGNSLEADVAGANAAGLTSVWTPPGAAELAEPAEHVPDHTVGSLHDLHEPPWRR